MQQLHPLQALEYQRLMLRQFTEMHKYSGVKIESNSVWKLCIYYGMFKHHFQEELKSLLITLANYRLKIYKHIISVLIYNLYKQTPNLRHVTIVFILKQHKHLIDNDIQVESAELLKVHVVLLVLQILEKALSVQHLKLGHNRLEALKHLNIFIEDLNLNQLQAHELM
ncbi:sisters unbound [Cochliomyia hominivorax]